MPAHHACHSCGYPLSRIRAAPDPHYNLPIITCPECDTSVVRRRDPGSAGFRTAWKTARAGLYVLIQGIMATLLMLAAGALVTNTASVARDEYGSNPAALFFTAPQLLRQDQIGPQLAVLVVVLFLVGVITGAWTRSALNHLNTALTTAAFVLIPLLFILQIGFRYWLWIRLDANGTPWGDRSINRLTLDILTASGMHAAFIFAGYPFATTARNLWTAQQRARWSRRRRARRKLRDDR